MEPRQTFHFHESSQMNLSLTIKGLSMILKDKEMAHADIFFTGSLTNHLVWADYTNHTRCFTDMKTHFFEIKGTHRKHGKYCFPVKQCATNFKRNVLFLEPFATLLLIASSQLHNVNSKIFRAKNERFQWYIHNAPLWDLETSKWKFFVWLLEHKWPIFFRFILCLRPKTKFYSHKFEFYDLNTVCLTFSGSIVGTY